MACAWWDADVSPAHIYNFIGRDNIPFHTIIWPGMLIGYNHGASHLNLPYDVPASKMPRPAAASSFNPATSSAGTPCWRNSSQAWRYVPDSHGARSGRRGIHLAGFMDRINNELVASWGSLVNRMVGFMPQALRRQGACRRRTPFGRRQAFSPKSGRASRRRRSTRPSSSGCKRRAA